ncbi:MAG: hypothetical protein WAV30_05765 [Microgenomates group bacterium]
MTEHPAATNQPQTDTAQPVDGAKIANRQAALLLGGGLTLGLGTAALIGAEATGMIDVIPGFGVPHEGTQGGEPTAIPGVQTETTTPTPTATLAATLDGSGPATATIPVTPTSVLGDWLGGGTPTPGAQEPAAPGAPASETPVAAQETQAAANTPVAGPATETATASPEAPEFAGCTINPDGTVDVPQASIDFMDKLKINGFDVMDITQWAGDGTIVGDEVTAGTRQNIVKMDMWQPDDGSVEIKVKAPWGNSEVSTLVYEQDFTENPQSIAHNTPFKGKLWAYPHNVDGTQGWTIEQAQCDAARATTERLAAPGGFENIGDVMVVPLGQTGKFMLVHSDGSPWTNPDGALTWSGSIDPRDSGIVGIRGILPLQVFIDLQLVTPRY